MTSHDETNPTEPCGGCGYDVSTLPDAEHCPECGYDLVRARARYLVHADPRWVGSMQSGLATMRVGLWLQFAAVLLWIPGIFLAFIFFTLVPVVMMSIGAAASIVTDAGVLGFARPDRSADAEGAHGLSRNRKLLRLSALCSIALAILQVVLAAWALLVPALLLGLGLVAAARGVVLAARVGLMSSYGIQVARRVPNHRMTVKFRTGRSLAPPLIAVLSFVSGLGMLVAWFWTLRLRGQLAWLLRSAGPPRNTIPA